MFYPEIEFLERLTPKSAKCQLYINVEAIFSVNEIQIQCNLLLRYVI